MQPKASANTSLAYTSRCVSVLSDMGLFVDAMLACDMSTVFALSSRKNHLSSSSILRKCGHIGGRGLELPPSHEQNKQMVLTQTQRFLSVPLVPP